MRVSGASQLPVHHFHLLPRTDTRTRPTVAIAKQSAKGILAEHRRLAFAGEVEHLVAAVLRFVYGSEHQHQPAGGAASGGA